MAATSGAGDSALKQPLDSPYIEKRLREEPYAIRFFQAVRLLERLFPDRKPVGRFVNPADEVVHFGANASLAFPASEIQSLGWDEQKPHHMTVNFHGLVGPVGVLPQWYTGLVAERVRSGDRTLRDFLDIFNHRFLSLFYQAWEKYRFPIAYERGRVGTCDEIRATQDKLRKDGMQGFTGSNPIPTVCDKVIRGGAYNYPAWGVRSTNRVHHPAGFRLKMTGVRCALSPL